MPRKQTNFSLLDKMVLLCELHARTDTDGDCRMWMRQHGLLVVNMVCRRCGNQNVETATNNSVSVAVLLAASRSLRTTSGWSEKFIVSCPVGLDNPEVYASLFAEHHRMCILVGLLQIIDKSVSSENDQSSTC